MRVVIYRLNDGSILRNVTGPIDQIIDECLEGEEYYINCPIGTTHIINNEPVTIIPPPPEPIVPTLLEVKTKKYYEMKTARDIAELQGFTYLGKTFDSDVKAMKRITTAVQAAQAYPAFSVEWACSDNTTITLDAAQMIAMPIYIAATGDAIHTKYKGLKEQIAAATTVEEVEAIVW
jgi:hypothetical protein